MWAKALLMAPVAALVCACGSEEVSSVDSDDALTGAPIPVFPVWAAATMGRQILDLYPGSPDKPEACLGYVDALVEYYSGDAGAMYEGWAWSASQKRPYAKLVATDASGVVQGAGETSIEREDVTAAMPSITNSRVGYAVVARIANGTVKIYGINDETRSACAVGQYPAK